jgi:hypothetical protein
MAASLDDILTAQKNGVIGINNISDVNLSAIGTLNSGEITAKTAFSSKYNYVVRISVIVAGSSTGMIYDATNTGAATTGTRVAVIQNTVGIYDIKLACNSGIVIEPGTGGMVLAMTYS